MKRTTDALQQCFALDTCHHSYQHKWSAENPSVGHCAIASLVLHEMFGGSIMKTKVGHSTHYYNVIDDVVLDSTSAQFNVPIPYGMGVLCNSKKMLKVQDTKERYEVLKKRLLANLEV